MNMGCRAKRRAARVTGRGLLRRGRRRTARRGKVIGTMATGHPCGDIGISHNFVEQAPIGFLVVVAFDNEPLVAAVGAVRLDRCDLGG